MREKIQEAVKFLSEKFPSAPDIGLILGSGLGEYAENFPDPVVIPYSEIPHFPRSTVVGHKGHFIHTLPPRIKQTVTLDQLAYAVKSNFAFKVLRVDQISLSCLPKVIKKVSSL